MDAGIKQVYGNRVRVRVCGLCWEEGKLLMVNHRRLTDGDFWAPPGGGLEFDESVEGCLRREFREETGLEVIQGKLLFACEFMQDALHAIELFFEVSSCGGTLRKGTDPELDIIGDVQFMTPTALQNIPEKNRHGIFQLVPSAEHLMKLTGFFRI
jgi:8-oxo-dGTP diphosphatase